MANYISKYTGAQIDKAVGDVLNGNVGGTGGGGNITIDDTLTKAGAAADAKATGDRLTALSEEIDALKESGTGGGTNWGESNAGKVLVTDIEGNTLPASVGEGLELAYGVGKNIFNGVWENAKYTKGVYEPFTHGRNFAGVEELFPVTPNTKYAISRQTSPASGVAVLYPQEFDEYENWIEGSSVISGFSMDLVKVSSAVLTTGPHTHYISFYIYGEDEWQNLVPGKFMVEKGKLATEYEDYTVNAAQLVIKKERAIPAYWNAHLDEKISAVNHLHEELGKDCFSFVAIADMHYGNNLGKLSPILAKSIMDACDIKYAYALGDFTGSNSLNQKDKLLEEMENVETMLSPIRDRLLVVQGNHDGTWGSVDQNADGTITSPERNSYIITPGEMHHWLFRKVGLIGNVHFDETGTAYYIDDTASRVRYIALNSSCLDYELDNNGYSKYNAMAMFRFTQKQYDFLVEALMDGLDERWSVVIGAHAPLVAYETMWNGETGVEYTLMRDFLTAFRNKTTFSGSFVGTADNGFDDVSIEADFTKAEATLVGYFAGHIHDDYHYPHTTHGIDMIGTGADRQREEMTAGTDTEQSFDVVTVDTKNHKIYCTKIGFGDDREISYD